MNDQKNRYRTIQHLVKVCLEFTDIVVAFRKDPVLYPTKPECGFDGVGNVSLGLRSRLEFSEKRLVILLLLEVILLDTTPEHRED